MMDFRVYREPHVWGHSTAFIEICPGRYTGVHFRKGCLFVDEDAFIYAEGILRKHFPAYDPYDMQDIPKEVWHAIAADWASAADGLTCLSALEAMRRLGLKWPLDPDEWSQHSQPVSAMLRALAQESLALGASEDWICVLGV
jgi:hypothetical protein